MTKGTIQQVVEDGMCTGCGVCAGICPTEAIGFMWDKYGDYVAYVDEKRCRDCGLCVQVCPGKEINFNQFAQFQDNFAQDGYSLKQGVGFCKGIKLVRTTDKQALERGTSGGGVRIVAEYLVQNKLVEGAIMITNNHETTSFPFYAKPAILYDAESIKYNKVHSRYCPAPLGKVLRKVDKNKKYVFIGLPCHVHALRKLQVTDKQWKGVVPYVLGLLCAGTPTMKGNKYLFKVNGVDITKIRRVDYRDGEFPGAVYGFMEDGKKVKVKSAGYYAPGTSLSKSIIGEVFMSSFFYRRRCLSCLDFFCSFSDLAFGDPWLERYRKEKEGASLVFIRSNVGKKVFDKVCSDGLLLKLYDVSPDEIKKTIDYQAKKWEGYYGLKRYSRYFHLQVPVYQGVKLDAKRFLNIGGLVDLCCAEIGVHESLLWITKYIQFFRIGIRVLIRKLRKICQF